jgi:RNA polymerase sigma factor (sigma-70 family)
MTDGPLHRLLGMVRRIAAPDAGPTSDEQLLRRYVATGDESAFELLVWRHGAMVLGVCRRALRDPHAAEDAFQATFFALARQARSVRQGEALPAWLHRVARRVAARAQAAAARQAWHERRAAVAEAILAAEDSTELRAVLDEELDRLPERFRLPAVLCYLEGLSTAEAARRLGCPRGTVLSRLATARLKLRVRLTRRGITLPAGGLVVLAGSTDAPAALIAPTVRAALAFAAGGTGAAAPEVIALAKGVLRAMIVSKLKFAAAVALAVGLVGTGAGWVVWPGAGPGPVFAETIQLPSSKVELPPATRDQQANVEAERLLHELEVRHEHETQRELEQLVQTKLELFDAEEKYRNVQNEIKGVHLAEVPFSQTPDGVRLKQLRQQSVARGADPSELQSIEERIQAGEKKVQEKLAQARAQYDLLKNGELPAARRRYFLAEAKYKLFEQQVTGRSQRRQDQIEALNEQLAQMRGISTRPATDVGRIAELERKLDDLLREVKELRREIKK